MLPNRQHINCLSKWGMLYLLCSVNVTLADTLPAATGGQAPASFEELWADFDPEFEPLDVEVLHSWEQDGVDLKVVRFRVGVFKGQESKIAAVYGVPKQGTNLPGLVQIHGGGQYAHHLPCLLNAKRGYATLSIAWAGRISAPDYRVGPDEVQLFWNDDVDHPDYRPTTDWGAVDGYHAPTRNQGNSFPNVRPDAWTIDRVDSPRNSGWFLCAMAARRALTFLQQQEQVDPDRLGVYGHSMGGKLTVMVASDPRVKAAAPSCGGISDRDNDHPIFRSTLGDNTSLKHIDCPIIFLSPANDFHGRIGDLPKAIQEIQSKQWRVTCSPHHNHQDTPPFEVASMLWFDQHLQHRFAWPQSPTTSLVLNTNDGVPVVHVDADDSLPIRSVDVYYTRQGKEHETSADRDHTVHRYWFHAPAATDGQQWHAELPQPSDDGPLWVFANVTYDLPHSVTGAGYYYREYTTDRFNVSSLMLSVSKSRLVAAGVRPSLHPTRLLEDFGGDWQKRWFTYQPDHWARRTNQVYASIYHAPPNARLTVDVQTQRPNTLVLAIDEYAASVELQGSSGWQTVVVDVNDFRNLAGDSLTDWQGIHQLMLTDTLRLKPSRGSDLNSRTIGQRWSGPDPKFRDLRWIAVDPEKDHSATSDSP